jgi:hypothetical protein
MDREILYCIRSRLSTFERERHFMMATKTVYVFQFSFPVLLML